MPVPRAINTIEENAFALACLGKYSGVFCCNGH